MFEGAPPPGSHAECRAAGGELEPPDRGGRCFVYYTRDRDVSAYTTCRTAGGVARAVGPGRSVAGQSHVCTRVFHLLADAPRAPEDP